MSDETKSGSLIANGGSGIVGMFHGAGGPIDVPMPFERDIFLFDTYVAGTMYVEGIEELEPLLNIGNKLDFLREPDNEYDDKAILIRTASGTKIGYVPRRDNAVFARLMDAGKCLFARISNKEIIYENPNIDKWIKISIKVYLHE